ncbi:MAG: inositol monophosphatase [Bryobacteraceae bacterium]|nr:inositol monophosphatase [Bryobacteraceae bacterium]
MSSFLESAMEIAREAGATLMRFYERNVGFEYKGPHDLVTAADRASEALIVERLQAHFPAHSIMGEEGGNYAGSSEYKWYVDPLDGTTNFAHGFPVFNVTLAVERSGQLLAGVIFDPTRQEMFAAERGAGAWLNNRRLKVSGVGRLEESLFATGFPNWRRHQDVNVHFFHQVAMVTHGVRRAGSAAIDLAYVACGRFEGFWEFGLNPWDVAAGILLIEEAGGKVTTMRGQDFSLDAPHICASNAVVHQQILDLFGEVFEGRYRVPLLQITRFAN